VYTLKGRIDHFVQVQCRTRRASTAWPRARWWSWP